MPAVRPFDDPASWLLAANGPGERRLSAPSNVGPHAARSGLLLGLLVVVALVETDVLGPAWPSRAVNIHSVERLADHVHVVNVGAGESNGEGNSLSVYEYVAFGAELGTIGWIGPGEVPPFGAFTLALSRDVQSHSIPTLSS